MLGVVGQEVCFPPTTAGLRAESVLVDQSIAFWRPLVFDQYDKREYRNQTNVIARLKSGVTVEQARADMKLVSQRLEEEHPATNRGWQAEVIPIHDVVTQQIRPALVLLSGAVACVLLIACANTGSLILVRSISRQPELAIRLAHGAGRLRVVRQLVTEAVVFCLVSGVLGLLLSVWGTDIIRALAPSDVPRLREVSIDRNVLLFALGLSVLSGVAVSLIPALLACRTSLSEVLKSGGRTGSASRSRRWVMNSLVVGETALCLMLLAGAATLIQGFIRVTGRDPGFRQDHLLTMLVSLPQAKYEWNHNSIFCNRLVERIETLPEVEAAAAIRGMPMQENLIDVSIFVPGEPHYEPADQPRVRGRVVTPGYFRTMQIPLLEGREFTVEDGIGEIGDAGVSVISESTAKRFWPGQSPVGQRFHVVSLEYPDIEVIGVVADVRYSGMVEPVTNDIYYHEALFPQAEFTLLIRTQVPPAQLGGAVQELVHDEEPEAVITDVMTMGEAVSQSLSHERFTMVLLTAFSLCALLLAVTGHYGVVSYAVSQRRRELGIRLAIGAAPGDLVRLIVREGALLSVVGLVAGIAGSFGIARLLHSSIPGFDAVDLPTVAMATVLLLASACIATLLPAWRTTRVQPSEVLRCE